MGLNRGRLTTSPTKGGENMYKKLRGKIVEEFGSQIKFSKAIGWDKQLLHNRMSGKTDWRRAEMPIIMNKLGLSVTDIPEYFY